MNYKLGKARTVLAKIKREGFIDNSEHELLLNSLTCLSLH